MLCESVFENLSERFGYKRSAFIPTLTELVVTLIFPPSTKFRLKDGEWSRENLRFCLLFTLDITEERSESMLLLDKSLKRCLALLRLRIRVSLESYDMNLVNL